jgi:hypothetical protein
VKLTTHLHLVPRSRMRGVTHPIPQYALMAWCSVKAQGQLYLYQKGREALHLEVQRISKCLLCYFASFFSLEINICILLSEPINIRDITQHTYTLISFNKYHIEESLKKLFLQTAFMLHVFFTLYKTEVLLRNVMKFCFSSIRHRVKTVTGAHPAS